MTTVALFREQPHSPLDYRDPVHCRRCGRPWEPDDVVCWMCGGEESEEGRSAILEAVAGSG